MFSDLLSLLQLTRAQVQYGYVFSGVPRDRLSDLAQHHYLVTFIAWHLARLCNQNGANLNLLKVVEICLVHDLGELLGGDINWFYARENSSARKHAKAFEAENARYLSQFFQRDQKYFLSLLQKDESDEYRLAKLADYMECLQFKNYIGALDWTIDQAALKSIDEIANAFQSSPVQTTIKTFLATWKENLLRKQASR